MDALIKNNVIKTDKVIVDIGKYSTKILEVHYASKEAIVKSSKLVETTYDDETDSINFTDLAKKVDERAKGKSRKDVSVSLPGEMTENKIVTIKNKKESDIPKIIKNEYSSFGKVSPITHVVDYAFLGKREEQGDTVFYCLVSAVHKSVANALVEAFAHKGLKVKTIVSSIYSQICLSELYFDEYENLNRIFADIGADTIRVTAFAEGIPVYTRLIDIGFNDYIKRIFNSNTDAGKPEIIKALLEVGEISGLNLDNYSKYFYNLDKEEYKRCLDEVDYTMFREIDRIIDLCSSNEFQVNKIYLTGRAIDGFKGKMKEHTGIDCEYVAFEPWAEKDGKNYVVFIDDENFTADYTNAIGLAICPLI